MDCIEETGKVLNLNNQGIVKYLCNIEEERKNLETIIRKQYIERKKVEAEIERLTYKLCLINKSLAMRIKAKTNYDRTIEEIKGHYEQLVDSSNKLRIIVEKTQQDLDGIMNKKTGTSSTGPEGDDVSNTNMIHAKSAGDLCPDECPCYTKVEMTPTKEKSRSSSRNSKVESIAPTRTSNNVGDVSPTTKWTPSANNAVAGDTTAVHSAMKGGKQTTMVSNSSTNDANKLPTSSGSDANKMKNLSASDVNKMPTVNEDQLNTNQDNLPLEVRPAEGTDYHRKTSFEKSRDMFLAVLKDSGPEDNDDDAIESKPTSLVPKQKMNREVLLSEMVPHDKDNIFKQSINPNQMEMKSLEAILGDDLTDGNTETLMEYYNPDI